MIMRKQKGFTLIELLIVIAIIGILASVILVNLNSARLKARDARRLAEIKSIQSALEVYFAQNGQYPGNTDNDCSGWDVANQGDSVFINDLGLTMPVDPTATSCGGYRYYRYPAGAGGCDPARGAFYVLGVFDMESSGRPMSGSPGWSCPLRNWNTEMDWVTGKFEK